jgi:hypothetical protein
MACHLKDRNNSGGLCWLIENLVDFSWRPTSKIVFQMASLFHRIAAGSIECPSELRLPVILLNRRAGAESSFDSHSLDKLRQIVTTGASRFSHPWEESIVPVRTENVQRFSPTPMRV